MRKITVVCVCLLCLCLAVPTLAAPCRDARSVGAADPALEAAVSLFGGASVLKNIYSLAEGEACPQELAEGVLLLGYGRRLLPTADQSEATESVTVPAAEVQTLLGQLFAGRAAAPETPICPCITRANDSLSFDITDVDVEAAPGAYIFSSWTDGGKITVLADLYTAISGFGLPVGEIPEDCLFWNRTAQLVLTQDPVSPLGYRLVSMTAYPDWLDGTLTEWELTMGEDYEVSLPSFLRLTASEDGTDTYTAEGLAAQLTIQTLPATGEDPLAAARSAYAQSHPDAAILMEPALGYFTGETDGAYLLCVCPEGTESIRELTLTFPGERQYEFSFYGEIIRNSFWCEGGGEG